MQFGEGAKALPGAIYGVLLILIMALAPSGVIGLLRALLDRITARQIGLKAPPGQT